MRSHLFLICFTLSTSMVYGGTPQVPLRIKIADIQLQLSQGARKRVQEKVNSLTRNDKYFQVLLDRANLFLPIVEKILKAENLPPDFKYLVMQESGLVANAVSTSNDVGFWQFQKSTAKEMGLKINRDVDERMHIATATRAAAMYLKQHNREFNNWLYALLAYNEGRGGARKLLQQRYLGAKSMTVGKKAHVYIIHFLAYKVAFESVLGQNKHPELCLYEYHEVHGKTLGDIANELGVDNKQVKDYNKWLKRYRVPHDTTCSAIIPMTHQQYARKIAGTSRNAVKTGDIDYAKYWKKAKKFPIITIHKHPKNRVKVAMVNKITGVMASKGDCLWLLAKAGNIPLSEFLILNDLDKNHLVMPGQVYYYKPKRSKADIPFHIARPKDTWWSVAQKYGIKKKALLTKNRLRKEVPLKAGRVLWLRTIRPNHVPIAYAHPPH